jgi:hypothetical protein
MDAETLTRREAASIKKNDDVIVALRAAHHNQVQLNVLADQKANINIGITLVFVSVFQSQFDPAGESIAMRLGYILLIVTVAVSLLLALGVVLPRTGRARIHTPGQMTNAFFFGMFTQLRQQEYLDFLERKLEDNETARRMLATDIYQIGQVLRRKYRLLRLSYGFLGLAALFAVSLFCVRVLTA